MASGLKSSGARRSRSRPILRAIKCPRPATVKILSDSSALLGRARRVRYGASELLGLQGTCWPRRRPHRSQLIQSGLHKLICLTQARQIPAAVQNKCHPAQILLAGATETKRARARQTKAKFAHRLIQQSLHKQTAPTIKQRNGVATAPATGATLSNLNQNWLPNWQQAKASQFGAMNYCPQRAKCALCAAAAQQRAAASGLAR